MEIQKSTYSTVSGHPNSVGPAGLLLWFRMQKGNASQICLPNCVQKAVSEENEHIIQLT